MNPFAGIDAIGGDDFRLAWEDAERTFFRGWRENPGRDREAVLAVVSANAARLVREYELKDQLDNTWAARPLRLLSEGAHTILILEDPGGEPLDSLLGRPIDLRQFLRLAVGLACAIGSLHGRGIIT
jgi:hypothetical protein